MVPQKPKCTDNATREMDFGFSISSVLEQMLSFLLLESNLIKVSTSRWLHLVHTPQGQGTKEPSPGGNQSAASLQTFVVVTIICRFTTNIVKAA